MIYDKGIIVPSDIKQAFSFYRLAAKQGNAYAQNNLAVCYNNGQGVKENPKKARHYYQMAAFQGNQTARENLINFSNRYKCGIDVRKDINEARYLNWYVVWMKKKQKNQ